MIEKLAQAERRYWGLGDSYYYIGNNAKKWKSQKDIPGGAAIKVSGSFRSNDGYNYYFYDNNIKHASNYGNNYSYGPDFECHCVKDE